MRKHKKSMGHIIKLIFLGSVLVCLIGVVGVVAMSIHGAPNIEEIQCLEESTGPTKVYDAAGNEIDQFNNGDNRIYVSLDEIPKELQHAILVLEDERFYEHRGIDLKKIGVAIFNNLRSGSISNGGTTITQQVVKNNVVSSDNKVMHKLQEQYLALQLEKRYSKDKIFEWYLNQIGFGQGGSGVQGAAQQYFGKDVSELSLAESVVLAVIPEYPSRYNPIINPDNNWEKVQVCLDKLVAAGYITEAEREEALADKPYERIDERQAAYKAQEIHQYFVEAAIEAVKEDLKNQCGYTDLEASNAVYGGGLQIYTTLDSNVQKVVDQYMGEECEDLVKVLQPQMAFVLMDYKNGEVKALAGGRDKTVNRGLNYATQFRRMPGSAFNILAAYAPALDMGLIKEDTVLEDEPFEVTLENGSIYTPKNLDGTYKGKISLREALYNPRNAVVTKLLVNQVGIENAFAYLEKFGFTSLEEEDKNVALALGGLSRGVTPLELTGAYSAIANKGTYIKPILYREVRNAEGEVVLKSTKQQTAVINEETAEILTSVMCDAVENGRGKRIKDNFNTQVVAGEVGIVNGNYDMSFTGYTPYYSATIWSGDSSAKELPEEVRDYQLDTWAKIMRKAHEALE